MREHCDWKCPGCGAPTYAADGACPTKCKESYPEFFPAGSGYVGCNTAFFPDPLALHKTYHDFAVEDEVVVPADIAPGEYVLGWRWDAEQTTQVWASCADITIV